MASSARRFSRWVVAVILLLGSATSCLLVPRDVIEVGPQASSSAAVPPTTPSIRIGTFNVHDLYLASSERPERMAAIAELLIASGIQVVGIQEAFVASDRAILLGALEAHLPYHASFDYGPVGSGLLIVSAFPIVSTAMHPFAARGKWYKPWHGDWWASKGVAQATLACADFDLLIMNVHAQAQYDFSGSDEYLDVRTRQMAEVVSQVRGAVSGSTPSFVLGDMNCGPGDFEYAVLTTAPLEHLCGGSLDHIFAISSDAVSVTLLGKDEPLGIRVRGDPTPRLSDHDLFWCDVAISVR